MRHLAGVNAVPSCSLLTLPVAARTLLDACYTVSIYSADGPGLCVRLTLYVVPGPADSPLSAIVTTPAPAGSFGSGLLCGPLRGG